MREKKEKKMIIQKVHGSGNDFFIIDERALTNNLTPEQIETIRQKMTSREKGLLNGADGLLLVEHSEVEKAIAKMRVINSDGSEASMCGNGLRTVARYLKETDNLSEPFFVETMYAILAVGEEEAIAQSVATYEVEISPVSFDPEKIGLNRNTPLLNEKIEQLSEKQTYSAVAVPNPHLISFTEKERLTSKEFERTASKLNSEKALFSDGVNVTYAHRINDAHLYARTFERGVGFTNACGTAMSATALIHTILRKLPLEQKITIQNPGGLVQVIVYEKQKNYTMSLIGNATITHFIELAQEDFLNADFSNAMITETNEQEAYENFVNSLGHL